ncbi:MAG: response regulator [Candidatus Azobacteroides sp.]|nr:response regulator [Candidatus Azobacteroides sp.]
MKASVESGIRFKAALIYFIVAIACGMMILYVYKLRGDIGNRKTSIEQYYQTLSLTNELIYSVNQAQSEAGLYVITKHYLHLNLFREKTNEIEILIDSLELISGDPQQSEILHEISLLLKEKGNTISILNNLFQNQNPIDPISQRLLKLDPNVLTDSVQVKKILKDTIISTTSQKGFWERIGNVFSPQKSVDTLVSVKTLTTDTIKLLSEKRTGILSEMNEAAQQAKISYTSHITAIEKQVNNLIKTDQEISIQLSSLLNKLSKQTFESTLSEIRKTEQLIQRNYTFSIIGGSIALGLVLFFILLIINDVNRGKAARLALKQMMETRHQLLLSVSHDIKSPLNSIMGQLEIQKNDRFLTEKQIASMLNSGNHIIALLENLLEFSSLEQGTLTVSESNFNPYELCLQMMEMFTPLVQRKNLALEYELKIDKSIEVYADALKIKQIVINVLSNAVKYTSEGKVIFFADYKNSQLFFDIRDTGAGIPEDQIDVLFEPFSRIEKNKDLAPGSGLGMYVVKGLIDLLYGNIMIDSTVEKGTNIEITIPVHPAKKKTIFSPNNILIIDDDPALLTVIKDMFLQLGYVVATCQNPEKLEETGIHFEDYDLVITDMEMGAVSGKDILNKIKAMNKIIPVLVMTGRKDFNETIAIKAGFDGFISKPVTMKALQQLTGKENITKESNEFASIEEMFGDDEEAMAEIMKVFVETTKENMAGLEEALSSGNFLKAKSISHKMLPMFQQMRASECVEILKWMDSSRIANEEKLLLWKEKITDLIALAEKLIKS